MNDLQHLIQTTHDAREVKRALAVQNRLVGRPRATVAKELGYTISWVDKLTSGDGAMRNMALMDFGSVTRGQQAT